MPTRRAVARAGCNRGGWRRAAAWLLLVVGAGWWVVPCETTDPGASARHDPAAGAAVPTAASGVARPTAGQPAPNPLAARPQLALPDGSTVDALNDVAAVAALAWGDRPWSPIVDREWHDGVEWYRHANGTLTTTRMVYRSDLARDDPATICVHPVAPVPSRTP